MKALIALLLCIGCAETTPSSQTPEDKHTEVFHPSSVYPSNFQTPDQVWIVQKRPGSDDVVLFCRKDQNPICIKAWAEVREVPKASVVQKRMIERADGSIDYLPPMIPDP